MPLLPSSAFPPTSLCTNQPNSPLRDSQQTRCCLVDLGFAVVRTRNPMEVLSCSLASSRSSYKCYRSETFPNYPVLNGTSPSTTPFPFWLYFSPYNHYLIYNLSFFFFLSLEWKLHEHEDIFVKYSHFCITSALKNDWHLKKGSTNIRWINE